MAITLVGEVKTLPLIKLFLLYLRLSLWTFGGGIVLLRFLEKELVQRGLLARQEMREIVTVAVSIPGSIMANLAFMTGKRLCGWRGAVVAVCGTALPPFAVILCVVHYFFGEGTPSPWIRTFLLGVIASVTALVLDVALERLGSLPTCKAWPWLSFSTVLILILGGIHPLMALSAGAGLGFLLSGKEEKP